MTDTFDRTQLDGKDREQLSEIAGALGVKAISRMRKADLVDAIVAAAGSNGRAAPARQAAPQIRSTKPAADDLAVARSRAERRSTSPTHAAARTTWPSSGRRRRDGATEGNGTTGSAPHRGDRRSPGFQDRFEHRADDDEPTRVEHGNRTAPASG